MVRRLGVQNPFEKRIDLTETQVKHARRGSQIWENAFSRIEALEEALAQVVDVVENANKRGRLHKLLGKLKIGA